MRTVQPIRDIKTIENIKNKLKKSSNRDYLIFVLGINTGLRISDILKLKVKDVKDKKHLRLKEEKTDKNKKVLIVKSLASDIKDYISSMDEEDYLFQSRKGTNVPITRQQAYRILNSVAEYFDTPEIGTHTLRKTFGYHFYQRTKDIALLMELFNHHSQSMTLRYIGLNQDILDDAMSKFSL